jgi:phosphoribosyl 1,2-cyclic phosphodiesterase
LLRFASLASGSSGNCLVIESQDMISSTRVLIDCGLSLRDTERRLARVGLEPGDIDAVLVTHEHGDHAGCVFDFAAAHNVVVFLTQGTLRAMKAEGKHHDGIRTRMIRGEQSVEVERALSGLDALVLECNYDRDMLWNGGYPRWLKERIGGPFGHLDNREAGRLLGALERSKLKHVIGAHLSQQNNKPEIVRSTLAGILNCEESWVGIASQDDGFDWREA